MEATVIVVLAVAAVFGWVAVRTWQNIREVDRILNKDRD